MPIIKGLTARASMRPLIRSTGHGEQSQSGAGAGEQQTISVDSDMVVILASLLCALISVVGLALVARCACRWPRQARTRSSSNSSSPPARGLKKKAIEALPTVSFVQQGRREEEEEEGSWTECAICLAELVEGEELRVLPRCNHAFHVSCIDAWLGAHASFPSCRAAIMVPAVRGGLKPGRGACRPC